MLFTKHRRTQFSHKNNFDLQIHIFWVDHELFYKSYEFSTTTKLNVFFLLRNSSLSNKKIVFFFVPFRLSFCLLLIESFDMNFATVLFSKLYIPHFGFYVANIKSNRFPSSEREKLSCNMRSCVFNRRKYIYIYKVLKHYDLSMKMQIV